MYNKESHDTIDERTFVFQDKDYTILHWFSRTAVTGRAGNFYFRGRKSDPKKTEPTRQSSKRKRIGAAGNKKAERKHGTDKKRETGIRSGKAEAGNKTGYGTAQSGRRGKSRGVRSAEPNEKTGGFKKRSRRLTGHSCGRPLPASASGTPCFRRQTKRAFTERQASDPVNRMNMQQTSIFYTILLKNR